MIFSACKLAMLGGTPAVGPESRHVEWPVIEDADREAVMRVIASGKLAANSDGENEIPQLEAEWAKFVGVRYCAGVSSGSAALQLALDALGVGEGDEVIVPALSFISSALAPVQQGAVPVFVDVLPDTFNLDPSLLEVSITERTRALIVVHLHGLPADMEDILRIAARRNLAVIEDAAQAHGAVYRGRPVGSIGAVNCFSLHPSKNLPTCGEGGLVTTDNPQLHERVVWGRQFGEKYQPGRARDYVVATKGWNHKLNPLQAAFARSQLSRFPEYQSRRERNVRCFLQSLDTLPGIRVPVCPADRTHAWHILRFRFDPTAAGLPDVQPCLLRKALHRALRAEGVPVSRYQVITLPEQKVFRAGGSYPCASAILDDSLCLQKRHLNPFRAEVLREYAGAFQKIWENLDMIARYARGMSGAAGLRTGGDAA